MSLYAAKDALMRVFHRLLSRTGDVSYYLVPYLRRCARCKRRADALHEADPGRTWEYHLNLMPRCPEDEEVPERSSIAQVIRWGGQRFEFHIPRPKIVGWGLDPQSLESKTWVPERDFDSQAAQPDVLSLQALIDELAALVDQLELLVWAGRSTDYDAFISSRSCDYGYALGVHKFLIDSGKSAFFSGQSLPAVSESDFRQALDSAIEVARNMVVVVSDASHASAPWLEHEWGMFLTEILSGRKKGNLVTVATSLDLTSGLPLALRSREVFPLSDEGLERLLSCFR